FAAGATAAQPNVAAACGPEIDACRWLAPFSELRSALIATSDDPSNAAQPSSRPAEKFTQSEHAIHDQIQRSMLPRSPLCGKKFAAEKADGNHYQATHEQPFPDGAPYPLRFGRWSRL